MVEDKSDITFEKWYRIIMVSQIIIVGGIFLTEALGNYMLYVTRSQGYSPETIGQKLIRYLLITTIINLCTLCISQIIVKKSQDLTTRKLALLLSMVVICTNVAFSHYQFATTLVIFVVPIMISLLLEDEGVCTATFLFSLVGMTAAIIARAFDPVYQEDIGPEAIIAYMLVISVFVFIRITMASLNARRRDLTDILVAREQEKSAEDLSQLSLKMLETLAHTIDAKDRYTNGHSVRVAAYSTLIAKELGWSDEEIKVLKYQALLHDIGKIGVPDAILNKPGDLTEMEFKIIQSHTFVGADILKNMVTVPDAELVAKCHHERFDGKGYPYHLAGEDIPLSARIVCIADTYDAMNSDRIYRRTLPKSVIREEMNKGRGTQFDPALLDIFLDLFDRNKLNVTAHTNTLLQKEEPAMTNLIQDMENVIWRMSKEEGFKDFSKFYKYMRNIGYRYNRTLEVLSINITPVNDTDITDEDWEKASQTLNMVIKKNIRAVDVYMQYNKTQHLVILLDAGIDNIEIITQRIYFDFNKLYETNKFVLSHKINNDIYLVKQTEEAATT